VILCERAANDREFSINDLAVSSLGIVYFTTLKDPEKGRLSTFDPQTGKVTVVFDVYGRSRGHVAVPKGTATNLCFSQDGMTLCFTSWEALYSVTVE